MSEITIHQLETVFAQLIKKLRFEMGNDTAVINLETDLYRSIPTEKWTDFNANATNSDEENVGSLVDDVSELKKLVTDTERPCTFVDFDRVASVLRAISEAKNPSNQNA